MTEPTPFETDPNKERATRNLLTRGRVLGALVLSYVALGTFQAGREVERPGESDAKLTDPVSWVAAPIADAVEELGIVEPQNN